jgi:hypothetical protein
LIQQYKEGVVVRTIPYVLKVLFPDNGKPLLQRIESAGYKDVYYETNMMEAYAIAESFGLGGKRTRKQKRYRKNRTYKQ